MAKRKDILQVSNILCFAVYLCVSTFQQSMAQTRSEPVHAGVAIGFNLPHVFFGRVYSGLGVYSSAYTDFKLNKSWSIRPEIAYSQNANYIQPSKYPTFPLETMDVRFNYLELPILAKYSIRLVKTSFKFSLVGGASFAHLLNFKLKTKSNSDITNLAEFNQRFALVPQVGTILMYKHIGAMLRGSVPLKLTQGVIINSCIFYEF